MFWCHAGHEPQLFAPSTISPPSMWEPSRSLYRNNTWLVVASKIKPLGETRVN